MPALKMWAQGSRIALRIRLRRGPSGDLGLICGGLLLVATLLNTLATERIVFNLLLKKEVVDD